MRLSRAVARNESDPPAIGATTASDERGVGRHLRMIFSMSSLEIDKWKLIVAHPSKGDPATEQLRPAPTSDTSMPTVDVPPALPLGYLAQVLDEKLLAEEKAGRIVVQRLDKLIVVSLPAELVFEPGTPEGVAEELTNAGFRVLDLRGGLPLSDPR